MSDIGKKIYKVDLVSGRNAVLIQPDPPSRKPAPTFHKALFSGYQPASKLAVHHPQYAFNARTAVRTTCPFVLLHAACRFADGRREAHSILVDFSDPTHPGIFDPNFGWMEPEQGFCFLTLEQAMHTIWVYYTNNSVNNMKQGLAHLTQEKDKKIFILAFQVYVQSLNEAKGTGKVSSPAKG